VPSPQRLARECGYVPRQGRAKSRRGRLRQKHPFLVARLLFDQSPVGPAIGRADAVQDARRWLKDDHSASSVQSEGEVHVLEVGAEMLREFARADEQIAAVETHWRPTPRRLRAAGANWMSAVARARACGRSRRGHSCRRRYQSLAPASRERERPEVFLPPVAHAPGSPVTPSAILTARPPRPLGRRSKPGRLRPTRRSLRCRR